MTFPTTGLLDDANRADEGPPPSANWTTGTQGGTIGIKVTSNLFHANSGGNQILGNGWWSQSAFGPDCEVYFKVASKHAITTTRQIDLYIRLQSPGSAAVDGYVLTLETDTDGTAPYPDKAALQRIDNNVWTLLGAAVTVSYTSGDSLGLEASAGTLAVYRKAAAGSWNQEFTRTDSTYLSAGYIGMDMEDTVFRLDDFSGGAIPGLADRDNNPSGGIPYMMTISGG